ncbi:MAG: hypothetical protein GEU28_02095 [Dehalococcoidia bacterium]|nr:hypothetical protein [Dehalococcoidia bacterium]
MAEPPPGPFTTTDDAGGVVAAAIERVINLSWSPSEGAELFDVEIDDQIVASDLSVFDLHVRSGHLELGLRDGVSTWRVRAHNAAGERWSERRLIEVTPSAGIRRRYFDQEDDGPTALTSSGSSATIEVGAAYAFGSGKGVRLRALDGGDTTAHKNHPQLPTLNCWVRLAVRPDGWGTAGRQIRIASIRDSATGHSEYLIWQTGNGMLCSAIPESIWFVDDGSWSQVQFGVLEDGAVEFWAFDGQREYLVGRGSNQELIGQVKDTIALGNNSPAVGTSFEISLDQFAVAEKRLPWARELAETSLVGPPPLDPAALPPVFSIGFGSCHVSTRLPYSGTAVAALAAAEPDLFVHLGDYGYADTGAYSQSRAGYLALWSDLPYEDNLARLIRKPWLFLASDHDLGGNDIDRLSLSGFAAEAFAAWQSNDRSVDPDGRYGVVSLDEGRIALVWLEGISFRSPLDEPDGPGKTFLGPDQLQWFLELLATSQASLILIASQTSFGHAADGWHRYSQERELVLAACQSASGIVRWISGDYHSARWARMGDKVAEWGAAPLAEVAQNPPLLAPFVDAGVSIGSRPGGDRDAALAVLTSDEINSQTSFGWIVVDTQERTVLFQVRDRDGEVRADASGFRLEERISYT